MRLHANGVAVLTTKILLPFGTLIDPNPTSPVEASVTPLTPTYLDSIRTQNSLLQNMSNNHTGQMIMMEARA